MSRARGTTKSGGSWSESTLNDVFAKAPTPVGGGGDSEIRKDKCGAKIRRGSYGLASDQGWEVDRINPIANGGGDELANLQPLQWENNRSKEYNHQPTTPPNNPAGRVIRIVEAMRRVVDSHGAIAWMPLYEDLMGSQSPQVIVSQIPMLVGSLNAVRVFIGDGKVAGLPDKYDYIGELARAIERSAVELSGQSSLPFIMDGRRDLLEAILSVCAAHMEEEPGLGEEAAKVLESMEKTRKEVEDSDLDASVKEFCLQSLDTVIRALRGQEVLGQEVVRQAVVEIANKLDQMPPDSRKKIPDHVKTGLRRFWDIAKKAAVLTQIVSAMDGLLR